MPMPICPSTLNLPKRPTTSPSPSPKSGSRPDLPTVLPAAIADLIDGVLILTTDQELIYANSSGQRILNHLNQDHDRPSPHVIPQEIQHICQSLIGSRSRFPNQHWLMQSEIFTRDAIALHIRARWISLEPLVHPCLLLLLEDRNQAMQTLAMEESQQYKLTAREQAVWILHRAHYTYKQIATELNITPNTVKKHMKNIHVKQKSEPSLLET